MKYPTDLEIRILDPDEWHSIAEIYEREFDNRMPDNPAQSLFYGVFLENKIVGFAHVETVFHLNAFYLAPETRNNHLASAIFDTLDRRLPPEIPLIALPDKGLSKLLQSYGFRNLGEMGIYRRDK